MHTYGRGDLFMNTQAAYGPILDRAHEPPKRPGLFDRVVDGLTALAERLYSRRAPETHFRWNAKRVRDVRPETVYCVELPVSDPMGVLGTYLSAGVKPDRVVFVGDTQTLTDDAYYAIRRKGALVHETPKKGRREQAQKDLEPFFAAAKPRVYATPAPNPYTYNPGPPKVTPEQLQALVDAIGRRRR